MSKTKRILGAFALIGAAAFAAPVSAAPVEFGGTGTNGYGIDFNPATGKTVYVFPGRKQIIADPVTNTKIVTRRNGVVVTKQYPEGSRRGGASMGLARFFLARNS